MATGLREQFLAQASVSLQDSIPSLAQQLRLNLKYMQDLNGKTSQPTQGESCPVCDSKRIESRIVTNVGKSKNNPKRLSTGLAPQRESQTSELLILKCQTCSRSRKTPFQVTKAELSEHPGIKPTNEPMEKPGNDKASESKIQKASSKKRARERKDRVGLQALLGKSNDNPKPANTFDLMDFMSSRT